MTLPCRLVSHQSPVFSLNIWQCFSLATRKSDCCATKLLCSVNRISPPNYLMYPLLFVGPSPAVICSALMQPCICRWMKGTVHCQQLGNNWRALWKKGVSDDLRLKSKLLPFSWTLAHRLVFMRGTLLRTYFLTWDLKFEELAYYFCLKLTQRKQQDRGF